MSGIKVKSNGCNEDGWDLYYQETRDEFEYIAFRKGYDLTYDIECPWTYLNNTTDIAWEMFHIGHVKGRVWNE